MRRMPGIGGYSLIRDRGAYPYTGIKLIFARVQNTLTCSLHRHTIQADLQSLLSEKRKGLLSYNGYKTKQYSEKALEAVGCA